MPTPRKPKPRKPKPRRLKPSPAVRVQDHFVRLHLGYIYACLREPQPVSLARIAAITGLKTTNLFKNSILQYWALVPWLELTPLGSDRNRRAISPHSVLFTFKQNRYLRALCEGRGPKVSAEFKSVLTALGDLRRDIDRRRKEANAERNSNWNPVVMQKLELAYLIDHIETELDKLTNLG